MSSSTSQWIRAAAAAAVLAVCWLLALARAAPSVGDDSLEQLMEEFIASLDRSIDPRAGATLQDEPPPPEPVLDGQRRSETEHLADSILAAADCSPTAGLGVHVPDVGTGCPSVLTESDRPGKRARIAMTTAACSEPGSSRCRLPTPNIAEPVAYIVSAIRPLQAQDPSCAVSGEDVVGTGPGFILGRYSPYQSRPARNVRLAQRVWDVIVQKGFVSNPIPIADSETHLPRTRQGMPIPGAVPRLNDHSDMDRVMSHYIRWFPALIPRRRLCHVDRNYRLNLEYLINCRFYHCGDSLDEFHRRHRGYSAAAFDHWCNEVEECNHREKTLIRFKNRFKDRFLSHSHPPLNANDIQRILERVWGLIAANPERIEGQAALLQSAKTTPPEPGHAPRLSNFSSMDLVLAHYAAVFCPNGTHREWALPHLSDSFYHESLARLLNCFFFHSEGKYGVHYERYGAYIPGSRLVLCFGVDKCNGGWQYSA